MLDEATMVARRGDLLEAQVDDELVGLSVERGTCYGFNTTATAIWAMLLSPQSFGQILDHLVARYGVDRDRCAGESAALLRELQADGLVELTQAGR